jgi:hypothetical protein
MNTNKKSRPNYLRRTIRFAQCAPGESTASWPLARKLRDAVASECRKDVLFPVQLRGKGGSPRKEQTR